MIIKPTVNDDVKIYFFPSKARLSFSFQRAHKMVRGMSLIIFLLLLKPSQARSSAEMLLFMTHDRPKRLRIVFQRCYETAQPRSR